MSRAGIRARRPGDWWFEPVPGRRVALARAAVFGYAALWLVARGPYVHDLAQLPARRFAPVGVLTVLDTPPSLPVVSTVWALTLVACALAASGLVTRLSSTVGALGVLFIATLASSYGQVFHTEHLLVMHLIALAASSWLDRSDAATVSGWSLKLMMSTVAVAYVLAGVAKLRYAGWAWISGESLRSWVAADNLRKVLLEDPSSTLGGWLAGTAWVWAPIAVCTLLVELGAPVAVFWPRLRIPWTAAAWMFHVGVLALMAIAFPYQLSGTAYVAFWPLERVEAALRSRRLAVSAARGSRSRALPPPA